MTGNIDDKPVRVVSLHWGYSLGGVGKYGVLLDKAAERAGLDLHNICIRGVDWPVDHATLAQLDAQTILIKSRFDWSWIRRLGDQLQLIAPAQIITHGFNGHFVALMMRSFGYFKGALLCSYHGQYHATTKARNYVAPLFNAFTEWYISKSLKTVAVADYTKRYLIEHGVAQDRVEVIHNGIEDIRLNENSRARLRDDWGVEREDKLIGIASRLDPVKGMGYLIAAFASLAKRRDDVVLALVGTGTEESDLRRQVERLGIESRVRFLGYRADIADCLCAFDIFALPSLAEYHSIALLEAMRAGKAIVATDVGGNTESVRDQREALIVPPADALSLEDALYSLVTDESLRSELGAAARQRFLAEFTEDVMLDKTAAWLMHCAENAANIIK
jgi:glycosyltransferase involved in cell wall biosynthesis